MPALRRAALLLLLIPACGDAPVEPREPLARTDLRAATGLADVRAVGVTLDPAGARVVLDEQAGLFRVDATGATVLLAMADLPDPGVTIRPPFTDLVAIAPGQYAMTAIGDGFVLDLGAGTLTRRFCYEPDGFPEYQEQRTNGLAFDAATGRLYAQPRTFDEAGTLLRSELGMYAAESGLDLSWWTLPNGLDAGGIVVTGPNQLLLGSRDRLFRYDLTTSQLGLVDDLTAYGVTAIDGLALDVAAQTLLILDGGRDELVEIAIADLAL